MTFAINEVGGSGGPGPGNIGKTIKKYPWLFGGGLALIGGFLLYAKMSGNDVSAAASEPASYDMPATSTVGTDGVSSADLADLTEYFNDSLTEMGQTVSDTLKAQNAAVAAALARAATSGGNVTGSDSQVYVTPSPAAPLEDDWQMTLTPTVEAGKVDNSSSAVQTLPTTNIWTWAAQNNVPVKYDQAKNTVTINGVTWLNGHVPGTVFDPTTQSNKIYDAAVLKAATGLLDTSKGGTANPGTNQRVNNISATEQPTGTATVRKTSSMDADRIHSTGITHESGSGPRTAVSYYNGEKTITHY